jgi:hypothetical protein
MPRSARRRPAAPPAGPPAAPADPRTDGAGTGRQQTNAGRAHDDREEDESKRPAAEPKEHKAAFLLWGGKPDLLTAGTLTLVDSPPTRNVGSVAQCSNTSRMTMASRQRPWLGGPGGGRVAAQAHPAATTQPWHPARANRQAAGQPRHCPQGPLWGVVAHHRRAAPAAAAAHPRGVPGDRPATVCVAPHGQDPGHVDLPQARRHLPQPGHPATPGYGPPRGLARSSTCIHEHASPTAVRPLPHPHPRPPRPGLVGLVRRPVPHPGR